MRRVDLLERLANCGPVLERSGVKDRQEVFDVLLNLDAVGINRHVKWMKRVERTCIVEADHYKDMSPSAWVNIAMINPGSEDVRKLRRYRREVRDAWKARPQNPNGATT